MSDRQSPIGLQHKISLESQKGKNVFDVTSAQISQEDDGEQEENLQPGHRHLVHLAGPGGNLIGLWYFYYFLLWPDILSGHDVAAIHWVKGTLPQADV